jgi:hypothetical protein
METSMREDLAAALDEAGENFEETPQVIDTDETDTLLDSESASTEPSGEPEGTRGTDEDNSLGAETGEADSVTASTDSSVSGDSNDSADPLADKRSTKAPIDWSPKEREDWSKIPRHLQDKIKAREAQTQELMANTSEARKTHESFSRIAQTYGATLSGVVAGDTPLEAAENLFSTVANLRMGTPMQKAQIISELISDFGVDIGTLDSALSGTVPENNQESHLEALLDKRMAPMHQYFDQMEQQKRQAEQQTQQKAMGDVQSFADNAEFINDVRMDMADLIDMRAKHGEILSLEDAYHRACAMNPQIAQILEQRKARQALTGSQNSIKSKRNAASSLHRPRVGVTSPNGNQSIRDTIAAAWDGVDE